MIENKKTFIKKESQNGKILSYLQNGGTLTVVKAYELGFGINLRSRISEIRSKGHDEIISRIVKIGNVSYCEYYIESENNENR